MIAKEGRPGPVLIDIPKDVTANKAEFTAQEPKVVKPSENICEKDLESAVRMIRESEKPYIFVGGGAVLSGASKELYEFVKKVDAPVTDSLMGKGAFREQIRYIPECSECMEQRHPTTESVNVIF